MRICFFTGNIAWGAGTERAACTVMNTLADQGHEISVVSLFEGEKSYFALNSNIKIATLSPVRYNSAIAYLPSLIWLRKFLKQNKPDVVVAVESMIAIYAVPVCQSLGHPFRLIVWEHFNFKVDLGLKMRKWGRKLAAGYADYVVTLTDKDRIMWQQGLKCNAAIVAIHNPLIKAAEAEEHLYNADAKKLIGVGRLTYQKGFDLLITAWAQIAGRYPDWVLQIIGSGEQEEELKKQAAATITLGNIEFIPATNQINQYYKQAAIFCMSSRFEGLPMVLLEAQNFGLPIISFDCVTGPAEIVKEGTGVLCPDGDVQQLALAMEKVMLDKEGRARMSVRAKLNTVHFAPDGIISQWTGLLTASYIP